MTDKKMQNLQDYFMKIKEYDTYLDKYIFMLDDPDDIIIFAQVMQHKCFTIIENMKGHDIAVKNVHEFLASLNFKDDADD